MNSIPNTINNEPDFSPAGTGLACIIILFQTIFLLLLTPLVVGFGLPYLLIRLFVSRPPNIPSPKTVRRYLTKALFAHEEVTVSMRIRLLLNMLVFLFSKSGHGKAGEKIFDLLLEHKADPYACTDF